MYAYFCILIQDDQEVTHRGSINLGGNELNDSNRFDFNNLEIKHEEKEKKEEKV